MSKTVSENGLLQIVWWIRERKCAFLPPLITISQHLLHFICVSQEVAHHFVTQDSKAVPPCTLVVLSGLPSQSELFRGSVCALGNSIRDDPLGGSSGDRSAKNRAKNSGSRSAGGSNAAGDATRVSYMTPLIVRKIDPKTHKESRQRDVITAIHTGSGSGVGLFLSFFGCLFVGGCDRFCV